MASAPQGFQRRVKERATKTRPQVTFFIESTDEDENGEEFAVRRDEFVATMPSEEQLMLVYAQGGNSEANVGDELSAVLRVFKDSLPPAQYKVLMSRFRDPEDPDVDSELLMEIFQWLMEQWQSFPTQPQSVSSASPGTTGPRSTGRVRGKGSTRSTSA